MQILIDTHTHTLANDHAFSTIDDNARVAKERGLKAICYTEHTHKLPGAPTLLHFTNLHSLPRYIDDVMIIRGAEINIMDYNGSLDMPEELMSRLEWRIASFHTPCIDPSSIKDTTNALMKIAENPYIDVIGHPGDGRYKFEYEPVIKAFAQTGKIVEINNHSPLARAGSKENCPEIARLCAKYNVPIVVSTDAHHCHKIGDFSIALDILKEIDFPEELVLNANFDRFMAKIHEINGGKLVGE